MAAQGAVELHTTLLTDQGKLSVNTFGSDPPTDDLPVYNWRTPKHKYHDKDHVERRGLGSRGVRFGGS